MNENDEDQDENDKKVEKVFFTMTEFIPEMDTKKHVCKKWMVFLDANIFRAAIREYAIKDGRDIRLKKNDPNRVRAVCEGGNCKWVCFASPFRNTGTWVIKTYNDAHECGRSQTNRFMNSKWLAKNYMSEFKDNENWDVNNFISKVKDNHGVECSKSKAYRTRKEAQEKIEGTWAEQYAILWDYAEEIKDSNVGSTVEFLCDHDADGSPIFKRLYICYAGCKAGFNEGCRKLIGLDGCHIKGPHPGHLLTAIGIDANNGMFPIAFAVVEAECKNSWEWFLGFLKEDVHITNSLHWTFITDKQKGLTEALKNMWEGEEQAEHRHCARHLQANFIKKFKGQNLKLKMMRAAKAYSMASFTDTIE